MELHITLPMEDIKLDSLEGVGPVTTRKLSDAGIHNMMDLIVRGPVEISSITGMEKDTAEKLVTKARKHRHNRDIVCGLANMKLMAGSLNATWQSYKKPKISRWGRVAANFGSSLMSTRQENTIHSFPGLVSSQGIQYELQMDLYAASSHTPSLTDLSRHIAPVINKIHVS